MSTQAKSVYTKRPTGRPATGHDPLLSTRLPAEVIAVIDEMAEQGDCSRSDIARELLMKALVEHVKEIHRINKGLASALITSMSKRVVPPDLRKQKRKPTRKARPTIL